MERLIDKIREKYPCPKKWEDVQFGRDWYCVGVAGLRYFRSIGLEFDDYVSNAKQTEITKANDAGNFERAWELLAQELEKHA